MTALEDAERSELIALRELRDAVATVATNRGRYWTRPGSRESAQQIGEQDALERVLQMIDGRMRREGNDSAQPEGAAHVQSIGGVLAAGESAAALVSPAEVVPPA